MKCEDINMSCRMSKFDLECVLSAFDGDVSGNVTFEKEAVNYNSLYTEPSKRRKGLASDVVDCMDQLAVVLGIDYGIVPSSVTKQAVAFWLKRGYKPTDEEDEEYWIPKLMKETDDDKSYSDEHPSGVVVMTKKLGL